MRESTPLVGRLLSSNGNHNIERVASSSSDLDLTKARRLLYVSHLFAQFSEVSWQFALTLFLAAFTNYQSLVLVSTYGLVSGLCVCLCGSTTGRFIDRTNRLKAAQAFIGAENGCVLIATVFCYVLLSDSPRSSGESPQTSAWVQHWLPYVPWDARSLLCICGIHVFGSMAQILDRGFLVAIERDWIVILSQSLDACDESSVVSSRKKAWLSETNVSLKQIDLCCKVTAPAVAGLIIGAFDRSGAVSNHYGNDLTGAALLVGLVNVAALVIEYLCTRRIYDLVPLLAVKEHSIVIPVRGSNGQEIASVTTDGRLASSLRVYLKQTISPAGLALSLL